MTKYMCTWSFPKTEWESTGDVFEGTKAKIIPFLMKTINPHIQEA